MGYAPRSGLPAMCILFEVRENDPWRVQEGAEARVAGSKQAPDDPEDQQPDGGRAKVHVPFHPIATQSGTGHRADDADEQ